MAHRAFQAEHIGSTAMLGLCAKPVLDVMLGVVSLPEFEAESLRLADRSYRYRPEHEAQISQPRYFVRDAGTSIPRVHLHAIQIHGTLWRTHLEFRDALRRNPELALQYARHKRQLACSLDKSAYTEAKAPFIRDVLAQVARGSAEGAAGAIIRASAGPPNCAQRRTDGAGMYVS